MGEGNLSMSKLAGGAFSIMAKPAGPRCNQCCKYCFYREKDFLLSEKAKNLRMSSTVLRSYIEQMISLIQDGDEVRFTWQGGEPLLCGIDFFEEAVELQQQFKGNHSIFNALQTNGSLITTTFARFFKRNNFLIGLSLDGPESIHNYYRHGFGEVSTYQQAMHGLECLKKEGVEFNVLVTVNRVNQESPEEIYDFLRAQGVTYMQFIPIVERQPLSGKQRLLEMNEKEPWKIAPWSVTPKEFGNFLWRLFRHWLERGDLGKVSIQTFEALAAYKMGYGAPVCVFSPLCGQTPILEMNGDLFCCDHYVETPWRLGNILEEPLRNLLESRKLSDFSRLKSILPQQCKSCSILNWCQGDCPKHRFSLSHKKDGVNESYLCKSYRYFYQHASPLMDQILFFGKDEIS